MNDPVLENIVHNGHTARNRWEMHRAGILNFWFYEEEEFALEDGRLVLRGTNGAGKSVTMQSFIPLVLDGDKRPHRLDPFGSKDRKIEYYLLGDQDEHTDRTGYLWLEFRHPVRGVYKTIGIGLRARRGASQVGFWGFVLEDGRRIGHDFWLYDRSQLLEGRGKYPLDRKSLEERIGAGGQVVQEQRAYRELVNRTLFGYHDKEAYTDLLQLLVQLRSPKLSKDVKPTAIYDILVQALPPLAEEELRPLSEVMEDMDQIADRLEELQLHRQELEKLNRSYEQYNRHLLHQSGERLLQAHADQADVRRQLAAWSKEMQGGLQEQQRIEQRQGAIKDELLAADTELELLGRSEAMEKQRELGQTEDALRETEALTGQAERRLAEAKRRRESAELAASRARKAEAELLDMQREGLAEMDELAGGMEFAEHGVYARYWQPAAPEDFAFAAAWRRDADAHRAAIGEAVKLAEQEQQAGIRVADLDKQLGDMRADRDLAEQALRAAEDASEAALRGWKDRLLEWKQGLVRLQLGEEAVQAMFAASGVLSYEHQHVDAVLQPVRVEADALRQRLMAAKAERGQRLRLLEAEHAALAAQKAEWEQAREPEPPRSAPRMETRGRYGAGQGAPLYEACEFRPDVDAARQASIEYALLQSGLLDAWVMPDGRIGAAGPQDDESWIAAQPIEWGYTLADVLRPVPSTESGLTDAVVEAVLRTFAWGEAFDPAAVASDPAAMVIGVDYYQLGPVTGKINGTAHHAQYIGKEARKRFKLAEIARLKEAMNVCEAAMADERSGIRELDAAMAAVSEELAAFPIGEAYHEALREAWKRQFEAASRFRLLLEQENRLAEQLRSRQQQWAQLKQALIAATAQWSRLKTMHDLREALRIMADYLEALSALQSDWREYRQQGVEAERHEEEAARQAEAAEVEAEQRDELAGKRTALRLKVDSLRKLMEELGISDLHARISGLKQRRVELAREQEGLGRAAADIAGKLGGLRERQTVLAERERETDERFERSSRSFRREWTLQLVPETAGEPLADERDELLAACRRIVEQLESSAGRVNRERLGGVLQDNYNAAKHLLAEYVLEMEIGDDGRMTLLSMRDRTRPQKPAALLAEMGELLAEQESLLSEKDRELFEEIILRSVGKSIRQRIQRAELWLKTMNKLMAERNTSSGLKLQLQWLPKAAQTESELNSDELVELLRRDAHLLRDDEEERLKDHFRSRVQWAKQGAAEERETLRKHIYDMLDYRSWFQFSLRYKKGDEASYRELTDARFNVLSGGEKAMSMYIPLFAATYSRYADASPDAPKIISLDEAFAGVDDENIRDLFGLLTEMGFDYMMTSQVLWGTYDTVPKLSICEIYRPKDAAYVTVFRYRWNGRLLQPVAEGEETLRTGMDEAAAAGERGPVSGP